MRCSLQRENDKIRVRLDADKMRKLRTAAGTRSVIASILWSIAATFAIIGSIQTFIYSGNGMPYFILAVIFGVLWAAYAALTRLPRRKDRTPGTSPS